MSEIKALHEQCKLINAMTGLGAVEAEFFTTDTGSLIIQTAGPANTGFWFDWGDGTGEWVVHTGIGNNIDTTHTYTSGGVKKIGITGVLTDLVRLRCTDSSFYGDLAQCAPFTGLTYLYFYLSSISGSIAGISGLTNLEIVVFAGVSGIDGDISNLSALTALTVLQIGGTAVTGDISSLSGLTSIFNLEMHNSSVTGDISNLATLTALTNLRADNLSLSYTTTTLPAWSNATIQLQDNAMTQTEVDNFLIDLDAAGGTGGTLNIAGTNSAPSSAAISAINSLIGKGWDLTITTGAELLADGDMEAVGVGAWTADDSVLSKEVADPYEGTQNLKVLATAQAGAQVPQAKQAALVNGSYYRFTGWARSDGTEIPKIWSGADLWTGTNSTSWQEFDVVGQCTSGSGNFLLYFNITDPAGTEYCEFDYVSVKELV
jgi:hypothetical protein